MDANMDYKLSNAINTATEQNKIRTKELKNFPICMAIGEVPSVILECLDDALKLRAGELEIAGCYRIGESNISEKMEEAVNYYKEKRENGKLQLIDDFYVSIFLMENLAEVNAVKTILKEIKNRMEKMGFKEQYRIGIYCFLDFEKPVPENKICQWEELFQLEKLSVCFFSQQLWAVSDLGKYQRAVDAAALHIFLNISKEENWKLNEGKAGSKNWKTLGYWKMDIFKYVIAEQLEKFLTGQLEKSKMEKEEYTRRLEEIIFGITEINEKGMRNAFRLFPVNYNQLERIINSLPLLFGKNSKYTYREVLKGLYGDEWAFYTFLKENTDYEKLQKKVPKLMYKLPGNIADVELMLPESLDMIKSRLQEKRQECLGKQNIMDRMVSATRNIEVQELTARLFQDVWAVNQELFVCELRIWFVDFLRKYLEQEEWKRKLETVKTRNKENIAFLRSVKREATLSEGFLETEKEWHSYMGYKVPELKVAWDQDILGDGGIPMLTEYIRQMGILFEKYIKGKDKYIFTKFVVAVQNIRRSGEDKFYTAYMDSAKQSLEYEYIFVNAKLFGGEEYSLPEEVKEKVKVEMPSAKIKYRKWVEEANIEMLAFKDLDTIRSIYGMRRKEREGAKKDLDIGEKGVAWIERHTDYE